MRTAAVKGAWIVSVILFAISGGLACLQQLTLYDVHSTTLQGILLREGRPLANEPLELHKKLHPEVPFNQDARYDPWPWGNTHTGEDGQFDFGNLPSGIYFIRTSAKVSFPIRLIKPDSQNLPDVLLLELSDEFDCPRAYVKELKRK